MDDFIDRNMAIRRGEDPDAKTVVVNTKEDLLYQTPADLMPASSEARDSELSGVADIMVRMWKILAANQSMHLQNLILLHVQEVELDVESKLKNIERTERARNKIEEDRRNRPAQKGNVFLIPKNFNSNFQDHRQGWQQRAVSTTYEGQGSALSHASGRGGGGGGRGSGGGGGEKRSTDEAMMNRFRARDRNFRGRGR